MTRIPIVICIDVEPDLRSIRPDARAEWTGFEETHRLFGELRRRLEAATKAPVRFGWFFRMDPQIAHVYGSASWVAARYPGLIQELRMAGDELGLHVHPWRWDASASGWVQDFHDQAWVEHCVRSAFEAFERSIGAPCRSVRFGDRWMNEATVALLEEVGARFDLTVEPGHNGGRLPEPFTGSLPDYTNVPRKPYRPSRNDFGTPALQDARDLWIIPVSTGSVHTAFLAHDRWPATTSWILTRSPRLRTGSITADPNPIRVAHLSDPGVTTLSWTSTGVTEVEVRVDAPDGFLFARTGPAGTKATGPWVRNGTTFHLQDASERRPPTADTTLATVNVGVTTFPPPQTPRETSAGQVAGAAGESITLNLAGDSRFFRRIADALLGDADTSCLVLVARSDLAIRAAYRANFADCVDHLVSHPSRERFVFETPPEMIRRYDPPG